MKTQQFKIFFVAIMFISVIEPILAQKITFVPQWYAQAQFAGYYVALEKGFYSEEGLDVNITHINRNSTKTLAGELMSNKANIISMTLLQAIQARAKGNKMVNVFQLSQNNPNYCITSKPIKSIDELKGCRVGRWQIGSVQTFDLIFKQYNVNVDWVTCGEGVNLFLFGAVDAILVCGFNEYYQLLSSIGKIDEKCILKACDLGYNYPTDGLYVTEEYYNNNREIIEKFIKATIKGWKYTEKNEEEALSYVNKWQTITHTSTNQFRSKMMLRETLNMFKDRKSNIMDFESVEKDIFEDLNNKLYDFNIISTKVSYDEFIKHL